MKPAPFQHIEPATVDETLASLREYGDEARVLAGGQSLVPLMNLRRARPRTLIDINSVSGLSGIHKDGSLEIGAMVRQAAALRSPEIRSFAPLLTEVLSQVGHPATRARGTLGGIVAHADPVAEVPAALLALDAEIAARGAGGDRLIAAGEFFAGAFKTVLGPDELVTGIRIPRGAAEHGWGFAELAPRRRDFAIAGAVCMLEVGPEHECRDVRIALLGVADRPLRAREAEERLRGRRPDDEAVAEAADLASAGLSPRSDGQASGRYRRGVAGVLARRALTAARERGALR